MFSAGHIQSSEFNHFRSQGWVRTIWGVRFRWNVSKKSNRLKFHVIFIWKSLSPLQKCTSLLNYKIKDLLKEIQRAPIANEKNKTREFQLVTNFWEQVSSYWRTGKLNFNSSFPLLGSSLPHTKTVCVNNHRSHFCAFFSVKEVASPLFPQLSPDAYGTPFVSLDYR